VRLAAATTATLVVFRFLHAFSEKRLTYSMLRYFYVDTTTVAILWLTATILLTVVALYILRFRLRRRRMPAVRGVFEEFSDRTSADLPRARASEPSRIQHMMNRVREIERKIEIVKMQNISDEAKNITIKELEEEKRRLEEEIRKSEY
jgi:hypothetical protein